MSAFMISLSLSQQQKAYRISLQAGCAVLTVADAAVSVGATVVKTGVNVVGAAVDAVLPRIRNEVFFFRVFTESSG